MIQIRSPDQTEYNFDSNALEDLAETSGTQLSFLYVHEWLWELTRDVTVIRRVNRFLHSSISEGLSAEDFQLSLANMGLNLKSAPFKPVCARTRIVREAIEKSIRKTCQNIIEADVNRIDVLQLQGRVDDYLPYDDLTGVRAHYFYATNIGLKYLWKHTFEKMQIRKLVLNQNKLMKAPYVPNFGDIPRHFDLETLNLADNLLSTIDMEKLEFVLSVDLSNNLLETINPKLQKTYNSLNLSGNKIRNLDEINLFEARGELNLSHNFLETVNLRKIAAQKISLNDNIISQLDGVPADEGYTSIFLDLANNRLIGISENICNLFGPGATLRVNENPLGERFITRFKNSTPFCPKKSVHVEF